MAATTASTLESLPASEFGYVQAQHLLSRAGFGGTHAQVEALRAMGLDKAVNYLVDYERIPAGSDARAEMNPNILHPPTEEEKLLMRQAYRDKDAAAEAKLRQIRNEEQQEDRAQFQALERWWLARMISTPRPLEEKLTLLWHGHFASGQRTVRDSYLMYQQNLMLRYHAVGSFAELVHAIVHDPAMIKFLNNDVNRARHPNENLARELMELFTLGEGHYTENDIKQGAKALTGYTFNDNSFVFNKYDHDDANKTILGQTGKFDGDAFVNVILQQAACAQFAAYKIYKHFVADLTSPKSVDKETQKVIVELASIIRAHNYDMRPALRTLFMSRHFYDSTITGQMIKCPVQLIAGTVRMLNTPVENMETLVNSLRLMGQLLFDPPTVAGWDGGRSWINSSTLFVRQNTCAYLINGRMPYGKTRDKSEGSDVFDPMPLIDGLDSPTPEKVVTRITDLLLGGDRYPQRRRQLLEFTTNALGPGKPVDRQTLVGLLLLTTAAPEYQLC